VPYALIVENIVVVGTFFVVVGTFFVVVGTFFVVVGTFFVVVGTFFVVAAVFDPLMISSAFDVVDFVIIGASYYHY